MKSKVALVRGDDRRKNIQKALDLIKEDIISKIDNQDVIIKPNCLSSSVPLSCTNVDALRGVLDFLSQLSPESTTIAETCRDSEPFESYKRLGYDLLADEYDTSLVNPADEDGWVEGYLLNRDYEEVKVKLAQRMYDSKCRISVAVAKTHDTVIVTGSWKNMMGALALEDKVKMHGVSSHSERVLISEVEILPQNLLRIGKMIPPHISVIDGYIGMEGDGPVRGDEKYLGVAIASTDFVAADAVCAKAMGFDPLDIGYLFHGNQQGLGNANLDNIEIMGDSLEEVITHFVPHSNYETQMRWSEFIPSSVS